MRVCAVSLPELRIELVRQSDPSSTNVLGPHGLVGVPLAVVVAPAPMTETKLLGNTRLSVVSREARQRGVAPGQTIAQARARATDLAVRVVRPDAVRDHLACLAEVGLAFGATVSFGMDGEGAFGDVVWIDVTGCAHLHAPRSATTIFDGETILASRLMGVITALGHTCSVAVADGPRVAAMLAREAAESAARAGSQRLRNRLPPVEPVVVRPGENARALAPLSVSALPLAPEDVRWLSKVGVRTVEAMRSLPREGLGPRLGARARDVIALIEGDDRAPLSPYIPPEMPAEELTLEYGIEGTQALTFVAKTLTDRLASRLQGRAVAAGRVELELRLDAAMLRDAPARAQSPSVLVALDLPAPLCSAGDLLAALRPKIERLVLAAPVLTATLRAPVLVHKRGANLSLFEPQPQAERALPRLVAELASDLGPDAVSSLVLGDSWVPEDRSRLVPFDSERLRTDSSSKPKPKRKRQMMSSVPEPTRLVPEPRVIARGGAHILRHLSRVEAVEWWKEVPSSSPKRRGVDYVQAWTDEGAAWIEMDRATGTMRVRGWFD